MTTVTPFSKIVALAMLVIFPFVGFYLGMSYQKKTTIQPTQSEKIVQVTPEETQEDLIRRCGSFDGSKFSINKEHFDAITGPMWAPDCRHAAWANWESGTGVMSETPIYFTRKISPREGLYVYDDHTGRVKRVYTPRQLDENTQLLHWEDSDVIIFSTNSATLRYNLLDGQVLPE